MVRSGGEGAGVQRMLGHRRLSTSGLYLTRSEEDVRAAVERAGLESQHTQCSTRRGDGGRREHLLVVEEEEEEGGTGGSGEGRRKEHGGESPRHATFQGTRRRMDLRRVREVLLANARRHASGEDLPWRSQSPRLRYFAPAHALIALPIS